jgi:hypothetical protein
MRRSNDHFVAMQWIVALFLLALPPVASSAAERKDLVEVRVWAGPNARSDPRVVEIMEHHACGADVAVIRVDRLPPRRRGAALAPELVVEFSQDGDVIRRWSMPVDSIVIGVLGERIVVPRSDAGAGADVLTIGEEGDLFVTAMAHMPEFGKPVPCPSLPEFGASAYLRCFEHRDIVSGQVRRIAYQGPCN